MNLRSAFLFLFALGVNACSPEPKVKSNAVALFPAWQVLSGAPFEHWTGVDVAPDAAEAKVRGFGEAVFRYPDGPKGWIKHGFRTTNDGTVDWHEDWHECTRLQFEVHCADGRPRQIELTLNNMEDAGHDISVCLNETKIGQEVRSESTSSQL